VVRLLGVCTREQPLTMIIEYMSNGSLKDFLTASKPTLDGVLEILPHEMAGFCRDVAAGMAFLTQHKFVHRDLAARYMVFCRFYDFFSFFLELLHDVAHLETAWSRMIKW
jgi:tRNA A-37 threonylcarbamoyl transferase component Bud32